MPTKVHNILHYNAGEIAALGSGVGPGTSIPTGLICMWSGLLSAIPSGWHLCDGTTGTPDLRSKFVKGAAAGNNPGGTGGSTTFSHSGTAVADHAAQSHAGGSVTRATSGITVSDHAAHTHAYGTIAVADHSAHTHAYGTIAVADHASHVHSGPANHTSVSTRQGTSTGNVVTTNTHGNTGNNTSTLTHTVSGSTNNPSATLTHTVSGSTDNPSATLTHTVNEPNTGQGHDHAFTQPSQHAALSHTVTQPSDHTNVEPPYYAIAFIMKT